MTPQELKNSILQLAIQGKLVEQRPEEGTAEELYKKLKKHHIGLKVCKDELDNSSMDFDIPDSWKMVELNQLFNFVDYRGMTPNKITEGIFLITASNIKNGYMDYTRKEYISIEEYEKRKSRGVTNKGDLLFTTEAPMGNAAVCDLDVCSCGQRIITFQYYEENTIIPSLYMYFILSLQFQKQLLNNCTGTTAKGIKADKLKHFLIPLPPLAEQKRIVAKIEELLPLIDRYEKAWSRLEDFNKRFPDDMQKSILQMAIQGKLVEQRPEEGTAEDLYKQIQSEKQSLIKSGKIKKEKPLPPITDDEMDIDIPQSWALYKLGTISSCITDGEHKTPRRVDDFCGYYLLSARNIRDGYISLNDVDYVDSEEYAIIAKRCNPKIGDVLISCSGSVGRCAVVKDNNNYVMVRSAAMVTPTKVDSEYLMYVIQSEYVQKQIRNRKKQTAQANLFQEAISNLVVPLPPLAEQKRIVAKIEELLPLCEKIK